METLNIVLRLFIIENITAFPRIISIFADISSSYSGSLATGLIFSPEKSELLLKGGNPEFYRLKNVVKNHVTLAGGQLHFEALQVGYSTSSYAC